MLFRSVGRHPESFLRAYSIIQLDCRRILENSFATAWASLLMAADRDSRASNIERRLSPLFALDVMQPSVSISSNLKVVDANGNAIPGATVVASDTPEPWTWMMVLAPIATVVARRRFRRAPSNADRV